MASVGKRKKIIVRLSLVLWRKTCVGCSSSNSECRKGGRKRSDCHLKKGTCPRHGWLRRGPQDCHAMFDAWQCPYKKLSSYMWVSAAANNDGFKGSATGDVCWSLGRIFLTPSEDFHHFPHSFIEAAFPSTHPLFPFLSSILPPEPFFDAHIVPIPTI